MPQELYFEDFYVGQKMNSVASAKVTAEEIKEFGQKYDPQPFHLDQAAGESSFFKGLAASGWLTAAIVMRLRVQSITVAGGMIGAGVEEGSDVDEQRAEPLVRDGSEGGLDVALAGDFEHLEAAARAPAPPPAKCNKIGKMQAKPDKHADKWKATSFGSI